MRRVEDITRSLMRGVCRGPNPLRAPEYCPYPLNRGNIALTVTSMKDHTSDEGWQIMLGLGCEYLLCGKGLTGATALRDVAKLLAVYSPRTVFVQDKREWDTRGGRGDFRDPAERYENIGVLAQHPEIFKATVIKDAHQRPQYHRDSAEEMGCHAWVTYYHPAIVCHLAPYVRPQHLIRTYHTIDKEIVPTYSAEGREGCLLSGAVSAAYPLRQNIVASLSKLPEVTYLRHPGYHREGCCTPSFLQTLSRYKVAICTSSIYGYAVRKIIEATACGCRVITDLPVDDVLPAIDSNLCRVSSILSLRELTRVVREECGNYNSELQRHYAQEALWYDYRKMGRSLVWAIEQMRLDYERSKA